MNSKELIHSRAAKLFKITRKLILDHNDESFEISETLRYCFLILRKPKVFFENFRLGRLDLDEQAIEHIFKKYRMVLPGFPIDGLLPEERDIIRQHNEMVREHELESKGIAATTIDLQKTNSGYEAAL